jgi:hypothetical protein
MYLVVEGEETADRRGWCGVFRGGVGCGVGEEFVIDLLTDRDGEVEKRRVHCRYGDEVAVPRRLDVLEEVLEKCC